MNAVAASTSTTPPTWFKIVAGLALVWMVIGLFALAMDFMMDDAALAQMSEGQRQLYAARPEWVFWVYAIAIFSGLAGAIGLLMRKAWAKQCFIVSLIAIVIQFGYTFLAMNAIQLIGAAAAIPFPLVIFSIGVFLLWVSIQAEKSGWLQ